MDSTKNSLTKRTGIQKSWSMEEFSDYKKWFVNRFAKVFRSSKKMGEKEFAWFNLMYGWKVNE